MFDILRFTFAVLKSRHGYGDVHEIPTQANLERGRQVISRWPMRVAARAGLFVGLRKEHGESDGIRGEAFEST